MVNVRDKIILYKRKREIGKCSNEWGITPVRKVRSTALLIILYLQTVQRDGGTAFSVVINT